jgi:hypothetical protein
VSFIDPGDQKRGRSRRRDLKTPEAPNLFDISDQPPPTPIQVKSGTSIEAAKEIREEAMTRRRRMVINLLKSTTHGLARFQVAERLGLPDHWITSTIDALIKMRRIEEHPTATVVNPKSGKSCAVLITIDSGEKESAA